MTIIFYILYIMMMIVSVSDHVLYRFYYNSIVQNVECSGKI